MKAEVLTIEYSGKTLSVKVTKENKEHLNSLFAYFDIDEKNYSQLLVNDDDRSKIKARLDNYKSGKGTFYSLEEAKKLLAK
jgi:hypothetical protein